MNKRILIAFLMVSLLLITFVCVSPTTVYAQSGDTDSSESLGESIGIIGGAETDEEIDGPLANIIGGLIFIIAGIFSAIGAIIGAVVSLILGIVGIFAGIVQYIIGLF